MDSDQPALLLLVHVSHNCIVLDEPILLELPLGDIGDIGVGAVKVPGDFLDGDIAGLNDHKVQEDNLKRKEADVEDVVPPLDVLHGNGVDELVEVNGCRSGDDGDGGTLGTEAVRQNLGGVSERKTGPGGNRRLASSEGHHADGRAVTHLKL